MQIFTENLNIAITASGAGICLLPLLALGTSSAKFVGNLTYEGERVNRHPILLAMLFLVVIPMTDLLLDIPARVTRYVSPVEMCPKGITDGRNNIRLTDIEKLLFLLAMATESSVWFLPTSTDLSTLGVISICTGNCSTILLLGPLLVFFQRSLTTYTGLRTFLVLSTGILGLLLTSTCKILDIRLYGHEFLVNTGRALLCISGAGYFLLMTLCLVNYAIKRIGTGSVRKELLMWFKNPTLIWQVTDDVVPFISNDNSELYTSYIPALHMISSVLFAVGRLYEQLHKDDASNCTTRATLSLVGQILVLLVELRICKNDIARGLAALLHAKKVHVRYISHELRTPLNSTVLGVQVLINQFKNRKDIEGIEAFETLCDINASCVSTANILDDLLCYEKLNFGQLELNQENETVSPYLRSCVSTFAAQARGSGVTLTFDDRLNCDDLSVNSSDHIDTEVLFAHVLQQHDTISIDKRKMNQVLRYLISNALRFNKSGGSVTVRASFVEDVREEAVKENVVWHHSNTSNLCYLKIWGGILGKRAVSKLISSFIGHSWKCSNRVASYPMSPQTDPTSGESDPLHGKLVLSIIDTGVGMTEENLKKYAGPSTGFNLERLHTIGDSGISLCITKGIVDLHGGNLQVYSAGKDMGCTFTIELPMTRRSAFHHSLQAISPLENSRILLERNIVSSDDDGSIETTIPRVQQAKSMDSYRVDDEIVKSDHYQCHYIENDKHHLNLLIVDDSFLNRKMLLKLMRKDGHNCEEAEDGLAAVASVANRMKYDIESGEHIPAYDAILMDYVMPNMDGPTATRQIRELGYKGIIFGVTGNGLPSDVSHFLSCGANKILLKPLRMSTFEAAMKEMRVLGERQTK